MANKHIIVVPKIIDEFLSEYFVSYHLLALKDTTKEVVYNRGFDEYEIKKVISCLNDEDRINSSSYSIIKLNNKEETYYFIFKILNDNKRLILLNKVLELWSELNDR
jgi:hypothetical protein